MTPRKTPGFRIGARGRVLEIVFAPMIADPAARPNRVRGERSKNPSSQVPGSKAGNPAKRKETIP
jgi:hypothetical protein